MCYIKKYRHKSAWLISTITRVVLISQPKAKNLAENGTVIACLTMSMSRNDDDGKELGLAEASSHAKRSYSQREGGLRGLQ